jgi:PAS domain S-box-containing protein
MRIQQPLEMILLRQLSTYLAVPMWMMDAEGTLVYYNEPAEKLLGIRYDEAGPLTSDELVSKFAVTDLDGAELPQMEFPIVAALQTRAPSHRALRFQAMDGAWRTVEVSAIPVEGQDHRLVGVFATFWEVNT